MSPPRWSPSRREQALLWWLQLVMRYLVGGGGLVWETVVDGLRNTPALLVFGALGSATDVFRFTKALIKQARAADWKLAEDLDQEPEEPDEEPDEEPEEPDREKR